MIKYKWLSINDLVYEVLSYRPVRIESVKMK